MKSYKNIIKILIVLGLLINLGNNMLSILEVKNTNLSLIMDDSEDSTEQNEKDNPEQEDFEQQEKILPNSNFTIRFDSSDLTHQFTNLSINNHLIHLEYSTPPPEILS